MLLRDRLKDFIDLNARFENDVADALFVTALNREETGWMLGIYPEEYRAILNQPNGEQLLFEVMRALCKDYVCIYQSHQTKFFAHYFYDDQYALPIGSFVTRDGNGEMSSFTDGLYCYPVESQYLSITQSKLAILRGTVDYWYCVMSDDEDKSGEILIPPAFPVEIIGYCYTQRDINHYIALQNQLQNPEYNPY